MPGRFRAWRRRSRRRPAASRPRAGEQAGAGRSRQGLPRLHTAMWGRDTCALVCHHLSGERRTHPAAQRCGPSAPAQAAAWADWPLLSARPPFSPEEGCQRRALAGSRAWRCSAGCPAGPRVSAVLCGAWCGGPPRWSGGGRWWPAAMHGAAPLSPSPPGALRQSDRSEASALRASDVHRGAGWQRTGGPATCSQSYLGVMPHGCGFPAHAAAHVQPLWRPEGGACCCPEGTSHFRRPVNGACGGMYVFTGKHYSCGAPSAAKEHVLQPGAWHAVPWPSSTHRLDPRWSQQASVSIQHQFPTPPAAGAP